MNGSGRAETAGIDFWMVWSVGAGWGRGAGGGWRGGERGLWMGRCAKGGLSIFERGLTEKWGVVCSVPQNAILCGTLRRTPAVRAPGRALLLPAQNALADESFCFLADSPLSFSMLLYSPLFSFRICLPGALVSRARMNTIK